MAGTDAEWAAKLAKINKSKAVFKSGVTRSWEWREQQLKQFVKFLDNEKETIRDAITADLGRPHLEFTIEWMNMKNAVNFMLKNGKSLMKDEKVSGGMMNMTNSLFRHPEPLGTVLIMGAWNYPFDQGSKFWPKVDCESAGCTAIVKPSEVAKASSKVIFDVLPKYLNSDAFPVFVEGPEGATRMLKERYDLIFFTGGTKIGKIVYKAAAEHLTPCILELGGQNPCWVDEGYDLNLAAKRILFGKVINSGQICISPNYLLCTKATRERLVPELKKIFKEFYPEGPKISDCYSGKMVTERHYKRLVGLLEKTKGKIVHGGNFDEKTCYIEPTVVVDVTMDDILMEEELFGPILPIVTVDNFDDALEKVHSLEKPLAAYCFAHDKKIINRWVTEVSSGGMCINDTIMHISPETLPFGGIGESGIGAYHGKTSFQTFSHYKSVMDVGTPQFLLKKRSAPYSNDPANSAQFEWLLKQ
ncbi:unnamed protein product [Oikopleura dioica]|uniref:Aldehyde dehydrogenase n=1 Tax=Oikopleura dioica TaxID=34765 RepID=E4YYD1_OIKDI|nr:unnamed protein product [Oikopleura dioica]